MPSELISTVYSSKDGVDGKNYLDTIDSDIRLSVTWAREELPPHVCLVTQSLRVDRDEHQSTTTWEPHLSWQLDRDDINRLIRTLRRARNTVFGADE